MNILVACEESQTVCKAFRNKGHRAFSCDIQYCSGGHPEWHILDDALNIVNGNCFFTLQTGETDFQSGKWDILIAHPPCTYLSKAGACRLFHKIDGISYIDEERYALMIKARDFFFKLLNSDCCKIAIENPTPLKICNLPDPTQIIQPYEFGHPYSKRTLLWLKGLPPLLPTEFILNYSPFVPSNTSKFSKGYGGSCGSIRGSKNYSKTFSGIAAAMADTWG